MTRRDDGPWGKQFDAHSSLDEVTGAAERWVSFALSDLASQLEGDPDFTRQERAAIIARAAPLVRAKTQQTFVQAWERLREEARRAANPHAL